MKAKLFALFVVASSMAFPAMAQSVTGTSNADSNFMDELDPFDPAINQTLQEMDEDYQNQTGQSPFIDGDLMNAMTFSSGGCYRESCPVFAYVSKGEQRLYLYVNGVQQGVFKTSTGVPGRGTPDFDRHPDGRIYDRYTSTKYPGGDYQGMGNMPYAVFIQGGFAIHGTGQGNWARLGQPASHGCIRIHPDNAYRFNRLVRQYGIANTWITVQ